MTTVRVRVPATSANLGPGFDTLGLALNLYNFVTISNAAGRRGTVTVSGEGAESLRMEENNIAVEAARHLLQRAGAPAAEFDLALENAIPPARGLGSSAAARAGALVAANEWARRQGWPVAGPDQLLALAVELEGHPDNVAAALRGGLVVSAVAERDHEPDAAPPRHPALAVRLPVDRFPTLAVFIPESELATREARAVLPDAVLRGDANFNVGRTALLLGALVTGQWDLLREGLRDRLHQEHRAELMPAFRAVVRAALVAGAYGATLSGAGPSVLVWLPPGNLVALAAAERAMGDAAAAHEVFGRTLAVEVDREGCVVL